jgi:hypothetical protein
MMMAGKVFCDTNIILRAYHDVIPVVPGDKGQIRAPAKYNHRNHDGSTPMIDKTSAGHLLYRWRKFFAAWSSAFTLSNNSQ